MTPGERWLATLWPLVRASLPTPPARVVDIGCGPLGGFVPMLRADDYDAVGIDPQAPEEPHYQRIDFERAELRPQVDAAVASTSLHHVSDPVRVIDRIIRMLASGGTVVVVEWAWEKFDQQTAEWCFEQLGPDDEAGWLHRRRDEWLASGHDWSTYLRDWAKREGLHRGDELVRLLDARLDRHLFTDGPYFFPDLADTTEADEQAAIEAGQMQPNRLYYVGTRR
jgi:SAM-dependent methyltransferase